jgi:hypothetical protein
MANHAGGWASSTLVRFESLDFIVTMEGGLEQVRVLVRPTRTANLDPIVEAFEGLRLRAPEDHTSKGSQLPDFDYKRLGRQLYAFLGPRLTQEDLHQVFFSLANVMAQLYVGEPLSPEIMVRNAPTVFPFGLRNAAEDVHRLVALCFGSLPADDEFVGMKDYVLESSMTSSQGSWRHERGSSIYLPIGLTTGQT